MNMGLPLFILPQNSMYTQYLDVGLKSKGKELRMQVDDQKRVLYPTPTKISSGDCNFTVTRPHNIVMVNGVEVEVEVVDHEEGIDGVAILPSETPNEHPSGGGLETISDIPTPVVHQVMGDSETVVHQVMGDSETVVHQVMGDSETVDVVGQVMGDSETVVHQVMGDSETVDVVGQVMGDSETVVVVGQVMGDSETVVHQVMGDSETVDVVGQVMGDSETVVVVGQVMGDSETVVHQVMGDSETVVHQVMGDSETVDVVGQVMGDGDTHKEGLVDHDLGEGVSNVHNGPGLVGSIISKKIKSVQKPSVPNKRLQNIKTRLEDRIKKMKVSKKKETNKTTCSVCKTPYSKARDTRRFGRWVGCESCNTWTHRKCLEWTEKDVDQKVYVCDSCKSN